MKIWEERLSGIKTKETSILSVKEGVKYQEESCPGVAGRTGETRRRIESYFPSRLQGRWKRFSKTRKERLLKGSGFPEKSFSGTRIPEDILYSKNELKAKNGKPNFSYLLQNRTWQKQQRLGNMRKAGKHVSAKDIAEAPWTIQRGPVERRVRQTAERITGKLLRPDLIRLESENRLIKTQDPPEETGIQAVRKVLLTAAVWILETIYSLLTPVILVATLLLLLAALIALLLSSAFTVLVGSTVEAALPAQEGNCFVGKIPYYCQGDYPDIPFNTGSIATDGCGITSFAMVAAGITGTDLTPPDVAKIANSKEQYNTVMTHTAIANLAAYYKIGEVEEMGGPYRNCCGKKSFDREYIMEQVESFRPVILSVTGGLYNSSGGGHYLLLYGAGQNGAYVYDPQSRATYEKSILGEGSNWDEIFSNAKHLWIFERVEEMIPGDTDAERLFHILKEQGGMTEAAAAGIVGNVYQETNHGGEDINIHAEGNFGGGIVGWTDYTYSNGSRITNFADFKAYAAEQGDPWPMTGVETQAAYLIKQLEAGIWYWSERYSAPYGLECNMSYEEFKTLDDPGLAARTFCAKYEQPVFASSDIQYRVQMAYEVYKSFSG